MSDQVRVRDEGVVRWLAIDRPQTRNGLTDDACEALIAGLDGAAAAGARSVIVTGEGGHFCSGADLKAAVAGGPVDIAAVESRMRRFFHGLIEQVRECPVPVIALVDGAAAGFGVSLAAACDLRVATERARFTLAFVRIGLCPDGGATWTLPRLVGPARALELLMTGDPVDATEALRLGLVNRVVPVERARTEAGALAARLAKGPPLVLSHLRRLVRTGLAGDLAANLEGEVAAQMQCLRSQDFFEGLSAFFAKREPKFEGR
jgi:2-(1,2-epoxy-1,2-dihydrophenyl)acetyl-CoA isomerase